MMQSIMLLASSTAEPLTTLKSPSFISYQYTRGAPTGIAILSPLFITPSNKAWFVKRLIVALSAVKKKCGGLPVLGRGVIKNVLFVSQICTTDAFIISLKLAL